MQLRSLRLRLLGAYRDRGEMLSQARADGVLTEVTQKHDISPDEAHVCMALYRNWKLFQQAEEWNHSLGYRCPSTAMAALTLIDKWIVAGSPRAAVVRERVASYPIRFLAALPAFISQMDFAMFADFVC